MVFHVFRERFLLWFSMFSERVTPPSHGPSDAEALWLFVKKEWDAISDTEVDALVDSFPRRCKRCVEGGGVTICTKFEKKDR